ncbi:MAG: hypothetical protein U1E17_09040 [Geminicoccaceae bacterium]
MAGLDVLQPAALAAPRPCCSMPSTRCSRAWVGAVDPAATSLLWQLVVGLLASGVLMPFIWQPPALAHWPVRSCCWPFWAGSATMP